MVLDKSLQSHLLPEQDRSVLPWPRGARQAEGPEPQAAGGLAQHSAAELPGPKHAAP